LDNGTPTPTTKVNSGFIDDIFSDHDMINRAKSVGIIDGWQPFPGTPSRVFYYYDVHDGTQRVLTP
jgi:hypothetical protein